VNPGQEYIGRVRALGNAISGFSYSQVIGLLFAFGGGSMLAFLGKLSLDDRRAALQGIIAMSLLCLVGVYGGIAVSEYQLVTPRASRAIRLQTKDKDSIAGRKYLREELLPEVLQIQQLVANNRLTGC
jgi:hypothetical protein